MVENQQKLNWNNVVHNFVQLCTHLEFFYFFDVTVWKLPIKT